MTERQRTSHLGQPGSSPDNTETEETSSHQDVRTLAEQLMASAQESMQRLGLGNATDFLNATRQSGGQ